jgi:hypothetical protein
LQLILVGRVREAAVFLFEVPTGAFADAYGRHRSIALSWLPSNPSPTALEMARKI